MKNLFLFLALIFCQSIYSQDSYYKSSIINYQNDTINGFISNLYDYKSFKFKKNLSDKTTVIYTKKDLKRVIIDDNVFETRKINVPFYNRESIPLTNLGTVCIEINKDKGRLIDTVFLQQVVEGVAKFFKLRGPDGYYYYFVEKNNILKELPPSYCKIHTDSISKPKSDDYKVYIYTKKYHLDTLVSVLNDRDYITNNSKTIIFSEESLADYIHQYNIRNGDKKGGFFTTKLSKKVFFGLNIGLNKVVSDYDFQATNLSKDYCFRLYGMLPMLKVSKNVFSKFGINYFTYRNNDFKKSITSVSYGLRYSSIEGKIRPYAEVSASLQSVKVNSNVTESGFPFIMEVGLNIPIRQHFLTFGIAKTPLINKKTYSYNLWSFYIGLLF